MRFFDAIKIAAMLGLVALLSGCLSLTPGAAGQIASMAMGGGGSSGGTQYSLEEYVVPLNKKLAEIDKKLEELVKEGSQEIHGRISAIYLCGYSEDGVVDASTCSKGTTVDGKKVPYIISVEPLVNVGGALIPFADREFMFEVATFDPNQKDPLKQLSFFGVTENGVPKYDLLFLMKAGMAVKQAKDRGLSGPQGIKDAAIAIEFLERFGKLMIDLGEGGGAILSKATGALNNPNIPEG